MEHSFPRTARTSPARDRFAIYSICALLAAAGAGCSDSSGDGDDGAAVVAFTAAEELEALTGTQTVTPVSMLTHSGGSILMTINESGAVIALRGDGAPVVFTTEAQVRALTGGNTARLAPLDELFLGNQDDQIITADTVSGLLIRLELNGTPRIHATRQQVAAATGSMATRLGLPRAFNANQVIAQDLETKAILLVGNTGVTQVFVAADDFVDAAGAAAAAATVEAWTRGGGSSTQFARFAATNNIVRIPINGQVARHLDASALTTLFPGIANRRVLDFVAATNSDDLLVLVGENTRGVALALVRSNGIAEVFASVEDFTEVAGTGYDLSELGVLGNGFAFVIDRGNRQVLFLQSQGNPALLASREEIELAAMVESPQLGIGTRIGTSFVVFPEGASGDILRTNN